MTGLPWAAAYRALLTPVDARESCPGRMIWHFCRDQHGARRLAGSVEDIWRLKADGTLHLQRHLHGQARAAVPMDRWVDAGPPPAWLWSSATCSTDGLIHLEWHAELPLPRHVTFAGPAGTVSLTLLKVEAGLPTSL